MNTTTKNLADALRILSSYAGGSDAPPDHPCRIAIDALAAYDAAQHRPDTHRIALRVIRDAATHNIASELTLAKIAGLAAAALDSPT